jgi:S-adenosylmethionine:tRNA ribosyltransferase-isomerase
VEVLLHRLLPGNGAIWACFARPGKRLKAGHDLTFDGGLTATVVHKTPDGLVHVRFDRSGAEFLEALIQVGHVPLPPYLRRKDEPRDRTDYQTVYAQRDGAVAAPTAGLHFTQPLLDALTAAGVSRTTVTLHVGAGTFLPVKSADTESHKMHAEWGEVTPTAAAAITTARQAGGRIVAVGTTVLRLLESAARNGEVQSFCGDTALFIAPGYDVRTADLLMTNFHLPRSTLFMLVSAFAGLDTMQAAYAHAIAAGYRFYSYGDACLLERHAS